jgi:hypothetical protein
VKKSVLNDDELTLSVLCTIEPLKVSHSDVRTTTHSGLRGAIVQRDN